MNNSRQTLGSKEQSWYYLTFYKRILFYSFWLCLMHCFQALSWENPAVPIKQLSSKCLCADLGKCNFRDRKLAEGANLPQNVTDPHSWRHGDNSHRDTILTLLQIQTEVGKISHFSALQSETRHYAAFLFACIVTESWGIAGDNTSSCQEYSVSVLYWFFFIRSLLWFITEYNFQPTRLDLDSLQVRL